MSGKSDRDTFDSLPAEVALTRLPSGRHGLSPSFVAHNQRLRLIAAMLRVLPEHGYSKLTVGQITERAGVSRTAFYKQFPSKEDCFLATYEMAIQWLCESLNAAVEEVSTWEGRIRTGVAEMTRLLGANPLIAHLLTIEPYRAGKSVQKRHEEALASFATALRAGHPGREDLPVDMAELLLGGVVTLIARYVAHDRAEHLPETTSALVQFVLIPYLEGEDSNATLA